MKRFKIIFISILSVFLLLIAVLIICFCVGRPIFKKNLKYWESGDYSNLPYGNRLGELLPSNEECNNYNSAQFYYHKGCLNFKYATGAYCLELYLEHAQYNLLKEDTTIKYNIVDELVNSKGNFNVSDYKIGEFEVCFIELSDSSFPHEIAMIAFDDSNFRIRYCYIVDMSLDYFKTEVDFQKWIKNNFHLKW